MPDVLSLIPIAKAGEETLAIAVVVAVVGALMVVDLLLFARGREPTFSESIRWSVFWLVLGLAVAIPLGLRYGSQEGINYATVYLIERTLSLDNLVVFLLIFSYFAVPAAQRANLLFFGIVLALVMRGIAIVVGVGLIERFHVITYILGAALLILAWRMWGGAAEPTDPGANPLVRLTKRFYPIGDYRGNKFFFKENGRRIGTPLLLALVSVVAADIAFAIDSIPAAFAITDDALVIWAANGFALLGLRALFALVERLLKKFRYLNQTIALVLGVVAVKLLLSGVWKAPAAVSLGLVVGLFAAGMALSVWADRKQTPAS